MEGDMKDFEVIGFNYQNHNQVAVYGLTIKVPFGHKWIAVDKSGGLCSYENKPTIDSSYEEWQSHDYTLIGKVEYKGDWRKSLIEIDDM